MSSQDDTIPVQLECDDWEHSEEELPFIVEMHALPREGETVIVDSYVPGPVLSGRYVVDHVEHFCLRKREADHPSVFLKPVNLYDQ